MTERVRTYLSLYPQSTGIFYNDAPYLAVRQTPAASIEEKSRIAARRSFSFLEDHSFDKIAFQSIYSLIPYWNYPFLFTFSARFDKTLPQIYIVYGKTCYFADAQTACV